MSLSFRHDMDGPSGFAASGLPGGVASLAEALRGEGGLGLVISGIGGEAVAQLLHEASPSNDVLFAGRAAALTPDRFDELLGAALGIESDVPDPAALRAKLSRLHRQERLAIAVLDGAEHLTREALHDIQGFVESFWPPAFGLVLVAGPAMRERLDRPANDPLRYVFAKVVDTGEAVPVERPVLRPVPSPDTPPRVRAGLRADPRMAAYEAAERPPPPFRRPAPTPGTAREARADAPRRWTPTVDPAERPTPSLRPLPQPRQWRGGLIALALVLVLAAAAGGVLFLRGDPATSTGSAPMVQGPAPAPADPAFIEVAPGD